MYDKYKKLSLEANPTQKIVTVLINVKSTLNLLCAFEDGTLENLIDVLGVHTDGLRFDAKAFLFLRIFFSKIGPHRVSRVRWELIFDQNVM